MVRVAGEGSKLVCSKVFRKSIHLAMPNAASNGSLHHLQRIERMTPVEDPPQMMMVR